MVSTKSFPTALSIAGFDPSGEAGVLADARTFAAFGLHASGVITSLTFQNRAQVFGTVHQSAEAVRAQVMPLLDEYKIVCVKIGMLPTREVVLEVARLFQELNLPAPVIDPVMISTSGHHLVEVDAMNYVVSEIFPLTRLVTPNIPEAEQLAGMSITSESEMRQAALKIRGLGARAVLIKGGHLENQEAAGRRQEAGTATVAAELQRPSSSMDVLDDAGSVMVFRNRRIRGGELHGSGCILSAAIAAGLGKGTPLEESIRLAKGFVWEAIRSASD